MEVALFLLLFVAVFILLGVIASYFDHRRREAMKAVAMSLGLDFYAHEQSNSLPNLENFRLFSRGRNRRVSNLMQGTFHHLGVAVPLAIFDYQYTTGSGKSRATYWQTVLLLRSDQLKLPAFFLRPENLFDKVGTWFGFQDIDLPDYPRFSRQYLLQGRQESSISTLFTDDLVEFYEARNVVTEANNSLVVYYRPGKKVSADRIPDFAAEGASLFTHLTRRYRGHIE